MTLTQHHPADVAPAKPPARRPARARRNLRAWAYASPTAALVLVFFVIPVLLVFFMSGNDWPLLAGNKGMNLPENYSAVVDHRMFWPAIWFTLKYTVIATVLLIGLGLGLAFLVQETSRWRAFLRTTFLLPTALGLASASLLFYALYSPQVGPIAPLLEKLGFTEGVVSPLGTPSGALWSTVALIVWRFAGFYMLLLLVGLQSIPGDVYEAARIDGASRWQIFRGITIPLLRPSLALSTIMCVTGSLLAFDQFYILTKGGPDGSTMTVVQLVYNLAFESKRDLGMAAALSVIVLLALVVINVVQLRALRGTDEGGAQKKGAKA
ncbi:MULTISPECIES: carbohydrate ABC transporter permease [Cellulomonas]|uniref:Binding-protein-dependent transport systems inner membrane component n=1 Tax=Cellulomonas gilvus (strain ATCC 13127 / NRRL B-14078) TaxID=593907 RepID=F8A388_CELGA|nr:MULTISPECIES: sugar ABC transporter permease [Cellulomonas]AEI13081.1 binding-protein-dependent transport systems inner membrane component [Cellulomonas gilvus ATCC 13127]MCR6689161.1 sugar ABC transporter permease [Cellulomonas sp.]